MAQVRLQDGTWATFDTRITPESANLPWRLLLTLAILLAAVLFVSYVAVRFVTRPLHVLASAADELGRDINRPPLPESGPVEVARAAEAFNTMQARLIHFIAVPQLLKRCIANLIENAVVYGEQAEIQVAETASELTLRIRDHGPGMPVTELESVFEPFYRLEGSRNRETGGTGLGLSIARNIARSHGGDVRLRNHANGGIEAILTLPRNRNANFAAATQTTPGPHVQPAR